MFFRGNLNLAKAYAAILVDIRVPIIDNPEITKEFLRKRPKE